MAKPFVTTDRHGQFLLGGKPWFLHGATYFGRRPGTCGGSWLGAHFQHNFKFLAEDCRRMRDAGLNTVGLFLPGADFFRPSDLAPVEDRFRELDRILDTIAESGLRTVVFPCTRIAKEAWCQARQVDPGTELWNAATNADAEASLHWTFRPFLERYADRPDVVGTMGRVGRFDFVGWDPPTALAAPVRSHWQRWLKHRFHDDFALARELFGLARDEADWNRIRLPQETPANFSRSSPRAFEYALMQQVMISEANRRLHRLMKKLAPRQLTINDMEGVEFPIGLINVLVPELVTADALWLECYNWEGMRGTHDTDPRHQVWLVEPVANQRTIELVGNAGYVQMLVRWMQQSGKALILCHGTDIGIRRGVATEAEQALMVDRFNAYFQACGVHGINYWCWTDDDLSRSALLPPEQGPEAEAARKRYWQAGETMGCLRHDGTERPLAAVVRATGRSLAGRGAAASPHEALVLFPTPVFQSLYRYRANCTGFGIFTSLARQGLLADAAFTSAGETLIAANRLKPYRLIILGASSYHRDHPEIPGLLLTYVRSGGTLFLPLALPDRLDDPYLQPRRSTALSTLSGWAKFHGRAERHHVGRIVSRHPRFVTGQTPSWDLADEAFFTKVAPVATAEVLVEADGQPLLYRHRLGKGSVYVFTWTLDVHLFKEEQYDYLGGDWDWLWQGLAQELDLTQDIFNPMTRAIREMTYQTSVAAPVVGPAAPGMA
jgi:hypothetical protein